MRSAAIARQLAGMPVEPDWCVTGERPAALTGLLELVADRAARDSTCASTPLGWCKALNRPHPAPLLA